MSNQQNKETKKSSNLWIFGLIFLGIIVILVIGAAFYTRSDSEECSSDNKTGKCETGKICLTVGSTTSCVDECAKGVDYCPSGKTCQFVSDKYQCLPTPCGTALGTCDDGTCISNENGKGYGCYGVCDPDYGSCTASNESCQRNTDGMYSCQKPSCSNYTYSGSVCDTTSVCARSDDGTYSCEPKCGLGGNGCDWKTGQVCVNDKCINPTCGGTTKGECPSSYECELDPTKGLYECLIKCSGLAEGVCDSTSVCAKDDNTGIYSCVQPTCSPDNIEGTCPSYQSCVGGTCADIVCGQTLGVCPQGITGSNKPASAYYCDPVNKSCEYNYNTASYQCEFVQCGGDSCGVTQDGKYCKLQTDGYDPVGDDPDSVIAVTSGVVIGKDAAQACGSKPSGGANNTGYSSYRCSQIFTGMSSEECKYVCAHNEWCDFSEYYSGDEYQCNIYKSYNFGDPYFNGAIMPNGFIGASGDGVNLEIKKQSSYLCQIPLVTRSNYTTVPVLPTEDITWADCFKKGNNTIWTKTDTVNNVDIGVCSSVIPVQYPGYNSAVGFKADDSTVLRKRFKNIQTSKPPAGLYNITTMDVQDCSDMASIFGNVFSDVGIKVINTDAYGGCPGTYYPCTVYKTASNSSDHYDSAFFYDIPSEKKVRVSGPFLKSLFSGATLDSNPVNTEDDCGNKVYDSPDAIAMYSNGICTLLTSKAGGSNIIGVSED